MARLYIFCNLCILLSSFSCILAKKLEFESVTCNNNEKISNNISCYIKPGEDGVGMLHMSGNLLEEVNSVSANVVLSVNDGAVTIFNYTEDVCKLMGNDGANQYSKLALSIMEKSTNTIHPCPFNGYVYITDIHPNKIPVVGIMPSGKYTLFVKLFNNELDITKVTIVCNYM